MNQMGAFQIVAGRWGHPPGQIAVAGVFTDHDRKGNDNLECIQPGVCKILKINLILNGKSTN